MSSNSSLKLETKKVRGLISDSKQPLLQKAVSSFRTHKFFRLPQIKPFKQKEPISRKQLVTVDLLHIEDQERKSGSKAWSLAAVHAHQCCASQKHPAFVHLQQLIQKGSKLNGERVCQWQCKEYLIVARKLKAFVKEQLEKPLDASKKHSISLIEDHITEAQAEEKPENLWDEFSSKHSSQLFEIRHP
ncbi:MAG: hypothetical protein HYX48_04970 [Chlamydiales bacterium]|nr:hypothetical protein [Chlamydiales bacterium]